MDHSLSLAAHQAFATMYIVVGQSAVRRSSAVLPRAGAILGEQVCIDRCVEGGIVEFEREIVLPLLQALDQETPI
jgi:hypothetical protein